MLASSTGDETSTATGESLMRKQIVLATLLCAILALPEILPAFSHTVLGTPGGALPYFRNNDHELNSKNDFGKGHVPGPLAYIWPGSGSNRYLEDNTLPPGYQSPFQNFEQPWQLAGSKYSPEGAIPASTSEREVVGDLIIGMNFSKPALFTQNFTYWSMIIYIPAPFKNKSGALEQDGFEPIGIDWDLGENTNIVTTITDSYGNISVTRAGPLDPFGPNWWMIRIGAGGNGIVFTQNGNEWYYVRINHMKAPVVAGRYFFKIFLDDHYPVRNQNDPSNLVSSTMPTENWPVLLVEGDIDPAIMHGTIRYGGFDQGLYGTALWLAGKVRVSGFSTGSAGGQTFRSPAEARGYFNASSKGHYEVEGIAPGTYDVYVSVAGFPEQRVAKSILLHRGQSLAADFYIRPGPEIRGEVFCKSFGSLSAWRGEFPISIVIYESDDYSAGSVASFSPTNLTHAPFTSYTTVDTVFDGLRLKAPSEPKPVAFPWEGPIGYYGYASPRDSRGIFNGVGPAQKWWTSPDNTVDPVSGLGSTGVSFLFQFGAKGFYGAPTRLSGMIPQIFATWIDGLQSRTYFVRAYVNGYVQTTSDGSLFKDYSFKITSIEHDSGAHVQIDLYKSGSLEVTVHFHDAPGTRQDRQIGGPDPSRYVIAETFDNSNQVSAFNFTKVGSGSSSATILLAGLGMAGVLEPPDPRAGVKYSLLRYRGLRDYGIPPGFQTVRIYVRGYIQATAPGNSLQHLDVATLCFVTLDSYSRISLHMYRGGGINATIRSVDWQFPRNTRNWTLNNTEVSTLVYDMASKSFIDVVYFWNSTGKSWNLPRTKSESTTIPWPQWKDKFGQDASYLVTNGSVILERFGPAFPNPTSQTPTQDMATNLFLENTMRVSFLYSSGSYRGSDFKSNVAIYPGKYSLTAWTYGHVQEGVRGLGDLGRVSVAVPVIGSQADSSIELTRGSAFNITMIFRKEGMLEGIPHSSSVRIRIYDSTDSLIAAASTSLDAGTIDLRTGFFADQQKVVSAGGRVSIPKETKIIEYRNLAGLYHYTELLTGSERVQALKRAQLFSPDYGIWGSTGNRGGYGGQWTVKIDIVNWYLDREQFHPAPPALLQGESAFLFPYNHLGPYDSRANISIPNAPLGGHASIVVALNLRAYVRGHIFMFNWFDEVRTTSWTLVEIRNDRQHYTTCSLDGFYDAYLPQGAYDFKVSLKTLAKEVVASRHVFLSDGSSILGENFFLETQDMLANPGPSEFSSGHSLCFGVSSSSYLRHKRHHGNCKQLGRPQRFTTLQQIAQVEPVKSARRGL